MGQGLFWVPPVVATEGKKLKILNFERIRLVRGVFALFSGAGLNCGVKTLIFGLLGGSGAVLGIR